MSYAKEFLEKLYKKNKTNFTHKDIQKLTVANCTYSVVQSIRATLEKDGYQLVDLWEENSKRKGTHKRYYIEKATA